MARAVTVGLPPGPRPRCKGCGRTLRLVCDTETKLVPVAFTEAQARAYAERNDVDVDVVARERYRTVTVSRTFRRWDSYDGFHSLRCALDFARAAHAAGYRTWDAKR